MGGVTAYHRPRARISSSGTSVPLLVVSVPTATQLVAVAQETRETETLLPGSANDCQVPCCRTLADEPPIDTHTPTAPHETSVWIVGAAGVVADQPVAVDISTSGRVAERSL
jgi:hypothetical protein